MPAAKNNVEPSTSPEFGRMVFALTLAFSSALAVTLICRTLYWETRNLFAIPAYDDMFDHLKMYGALRSAREFFLYLISAHNEHRIFTTRIISYLDDRFVMGRGYAQVVATNMAQIFSAWMSWRIFVRYDSSVGRYYRVTLFVVILTLFVNPNFLYTLIYPFQVQHAIMAVLCIVAASLIANISRLSEVSCREHKKLIASLVALAVIATLTLGNAPVILIAAAAIAIVLRWRRSVIVVLSLLAIGHTAAVLLTTVSAGTKSDDLLKIVKFALIYLGGPFSRFDAWPGNYVTWATSPHLTILFGAVVLMVPTVFALKRFFRPGWGGPVAVFGLTLLVMVIVTGLAAGHARASYGILEAASKKYASFAALGWVGVLAVAAGALSELRCSQRMLKESLLLVALLVLVPLTVAGYDRETRLWQKWRETNWESALAVFLQINDRDRLHALDENEHEVGRYVAFAEPRGVGIFSYFPFRWGDNATAFLAARREVSCRGEVESVSSIDAAHLTDVFDVKGFARTIAGWTWMNGEQRPASTIIAVDRSQRIVGVARTTRTSARAEEWLGQKFNEDLGWFGFARVTDSSPLKFYALSFNGKEYCSLGSEGSAR